MGLLCFKNERSPEDRTKTDNCEPINRFFMAGMGSAGKSTIIRQLQSLCQKNHSYKFCNDDWSEKKLTDIDKSLWQATIQKNILDCFDIFSKMITKLEEEFEKPENKEFAMKIENICDQDDGFENLEIDEKFKEQLLKLYDDEAIKKVVKMRNKINLPQKKLFDGFQHFFSIEKITEIFNDDYNPTFEDKIHSRKPTTNMEPYRFMLNDTKIEITDVGGQKSELVRLADYLTHWCYESKENDRNFILLVVSMSDYNVQHPVHQKFTLLDESVEYMKLLLNNPATEHCGLLIFFNKKDRFVEKLDDEQCREDVRYLKDYITSSQFKSYTSTGKYSEKVMFNAITAKFVDIFKEKYPDKSCYCRNTCAVDSEMMEGIFATIRNEILNAKFYDLFP